MAKQDDWYWVENFGPGGRRPLNTDNVPWWMKPLPPRGMFGGGAAPAPVLTPFQDLFDRADGAIGNDWLTAGTVAIDTESAVLTPEFSAEIELPQARPAIQTGTRLTDSVGWSGNGATISVSSDEHQTGLYSIMGLAVSSSGRAEWNLPHVIGEIYRVTFWSKTGVQGDISYPLRLRDWANYYPVPVEIRVPATWEEHTFVGRCTSNVYCRIRAYGHDIDDTFFIDNMSVKKVTYNNLFLVREVLNAVITIAILGPIYQTTYRGGSP